MDSSKTKSYMINNSKTYRRFNIIIGTIFLIGSFVFITHSLTNITGLTIIDDIDKGKSSAMGSVLLIGAAIMFKLSMRQVRKGQAAMEFLMTYGWSILALILTLGVLSYISVFDSDKIAPSMVYLEPPFYAVAGAGDQNSIDLSIRNSADQSYTITKIVIPNCGTYNTPFSIGSGATAELSVQCDQELAPNTKFDENLEVTYNSFGSTLDRVVTGEINVNIKSGIGSIIFPKSIDNDLDKIINTLDNCPTVYNPGQEDLDQDGIGDACDSSNTLCGNNITEGSEVCDGTDLNGITCTAPLFCPGLSSNCPYVGTGLKCNRDCTGYNITECTLTQCSDNIDNDENGMMDDNDLGCSNPADNNESGGDIGFVVRQRP